MMRLLGRVTGKILLRATAAFGLSYLFWLVFYFDFLKESLESVSPLIEPSALVNVPLSILGLALAVALVVAIATCWVGTTNFIRGVVIVGVVLSISSLASIGLGSPLAWVSLVLAMAALFAVWKWKTTRLVGLAFLCGILGTGYALLSQGLWVWANWATAETESPAAVSTDSPGHNLPSVYVVVMEEFSLSLVNKYASFLSLPNLSRLAQEGVFFPRAYSIADSTILSIPSFFTGKYPDASQISKYSFDTDWLTDSRNLITDLVALDYKVKVYNDLFGIKTKLTCSPLKMETESLAVISPDDLRAFAVKHFARQVTFGLYSAPSIGGLLQGQPARVFDLEHDPNQPQLVYIHLFDSHHNYVRNRDGSFHDSPYVAFNGVSEEDAPKVAENAFEQIIWADTVAGPLVDALLAIPPEERIVVFFSDHSISWREPPFYRETGFLNSTQVHIPAILVAPGLTPRIDPELLPLIDLYPTIVDILNKAAGETILAALESIDGLSLFDGSASRQTRPYYGFSVDCRYELVEDNWVFDGRAESKGRKGQYTQAVIPAQELALTEEAVQLAIESALPKPLPPMNPERQSSPPAPPIGPEIPGEGIVLIEERFHGYNIFGYMGRFYGILSDEGMFFYERFRAGGHRDGVEGDSVAEVRREIVESVGKEPVTAVETIEIYRDYEAVWAAERLITISEETSIIEEGESSLKVVWTDSSGAVYYNFPLGQDWSASKYISFYVYGANSNAEIALQIRFMGHGGENWVDYRWKDNFSGWKKLVFELDNPSATSGQIVWTDVQQVLFRPLTIIDAILYFDYLVRF